MSPEVDKMTELVASETTVVIALSAASMLAIAITALIVGVAFFAVFDGGEEAACDVQRFVELTEEARSLLAGGPVLSDPDGETSAAIGRFRAKKEEARLALWKSRQGQGRMNERAAAESRLQPHSERESALQGPKNASGVRVPASGWRA
jgi:hypothetical protein